MNPEYLNFLASKAVRAKERGLSSVPALASHLFGFQAHCVDFNLRTGCGGLFLDTGLGKAQPISELILTPDGPKTVGSISVGDFVIGRDGLPTAVVGVFPQGWRPCYRVTFTDGASTRCDLEHLWAVRSKVQKYRGWPFRVCTLREIVEEGLTSQQGWRHFVPMPDPIAFDGEPLPIDPYLLGVLIGDGYLNRHSPRISSVDAELLEAVDAALPPALRLVPYGGCDYGITTGKNNGRSPSPNAVHSALQSLGLAGSRSETKFVPMIYKFATINDRIRLLQGLLDTDGHVRPADNNVEFVTVSSRLAEDVAFIVRSLGGRARVRRKPTPRQMAYTMSICLPDVITPFSLPRKAAVYRPRPKYKPTRAICRVERVDDAAMVCIKVAASDSLYVTADCVVTHNTECQLEWCQKAIEATNARALILTPLAVAGQTKRRADRWGYEARVIREQSDAKPGINICNYDRLDKLDPSAFGVISLDEASILKSFTGKTTRALIEAFKGARFKLCATATPAPNDHMELGQYGEFLDIMPSNEMLMRWFIADQTEMGRYRLKGHAKVDFWDWMASWCRMAEKPSDLGYGDDGFILRPFSVIRHRAKDAKLTRELEDMFGAPTLNATTLHKVKRQTSEARAEAVAALVAAESDQPWILWCDTDYEGDAISAAVPDAIEIRGSQSIDEKEDRLAAFETGKHKLIAKPSMCGFGLDWSHCARQAFVGRSYSYETWYQAVRRSWRFGQKRDVVVHLILAEGETEIGRVIDRKANDHANMKEAMIGAMRRARNRTDETVKVKYNPKHKAGLAPWIRSVA